MMYWYTVLLLVKCVYFLQIFVCDLNNVKMLIGVFTSIIFANILLVSCDSIPNYGLENLPDADVTFLDSEDWINPPIGGYVQDQLNHQLQDTDLKEDIIAAITAHLAGIAAKSIIEGVKDVVKAGLEHGLKKGYEKLIELETAGHVDHKYWEATKAGVTAAIRKAYKEMKSLPKNALKKFVKNLTFGFIKNPFKLAWKLWGDFSPEESEILRKDIMKMLQEMTSARTMDEMKQMLET